MLPPRECNAVWLDADSLTDNTGNISIELGNLQPIVEHNLFAAAQVHTVLLHALYPDELLHVDAVFAVELALQQQYPPSNPEVAEFVKQY